LLYNFTLGILTKCCTTYTRKCEKQAYDQVHTPFYLIQFCNHEYLHLYKGFYIPKLIYDSLIPKKVYTKMSKVGFYESCKLKA